MKKNISVSLLFAVAVLLAGCQKTGLLDGSKSSVKFSAVSSTSIDTKAAYATGDDAYTIEGGKKYQRIDWQAGDQIFVWSDKATDRADANQKWSLYSVTSSITNSGRLSTASVTATNGNGLVWGEGGDYTFYGVYPGSSNAFDGSVYSASIASDQGEWSARANGLPSYGYMTAAKQVTFSGDEDDLPEVKLSFEPAFTAFEINLKSNDKALSISSFELSSEAEALAGPFGISFNGTARTFDLSQATSQTVSVSFAEGTQIAPATETASAKELNFTVFALPQDYTKLTIRFTVIVDGTDPVQTRTLSLKLMEKEEGTGALNYITFPACAKHVLTGIQMSDVWSFKTITLNGVVIEWNQEDITYEITDGLPQASQFQVHGTDIYNVYQLHPNNADAKALRQTWVLGENTAYVSFKVISPAGGTWEIEPQGDTEKFTITGDLSGDINPRGATSATKVSFSVTPNGAADGDKIWFKTYVTDTDGITYSLDSETQLYDARGYHYFVINDPLPADPVEP